MPSCSHIPLDRPWVPGAHHPGAGVHSRRVWAGHGLVRGHRAGGHARAPGARAEHRAGALQSAA
jgi:hypothetical protein